VDHLKEVFQQIDYDNSGEISLAEMETFLLDPSLQQYLESMDIQPDDALTLFRLLDKDSSGQVSIDEFCAGCLRLKCEAKSFDIHCMIYENHRLMYKWQDFMKYLEKGFLPSLARAMGEVEKMQKSMRFFSSQNSPHDQDHQYVVRSNHRESVKQAMRVEGRQEEGMGVPTTPAPTLFGSTAKG